MNATPPPQDEGSRPSSETIAQLQARLQELERSEQQLLMYAQDLRRSQEEVRAQLRNLTALHTINVSIAKALNVSEVVRLTLDGIQQLVGYDAAGFYLVELDNEPLVVAATRGELPADLPLPAAARELEGMTAELTGGLLRVPLRSGNRNVGLLVLHRADHPFSADDVQLVELVSAQAAVGVQNAHVFEVTHAQAITDGLTGLFNHRYFDQALVAEVERAARLNYPVGLLMADLDRFKAVNDNLGHQVGDRLLREVAAAVKSGVRKTDLVARYGGDEIVVILPGCRRQYLASVAEKLRRSAQQVAARVSKEVPVTLSVGGAMFPEDAGTATDLVSSADRALYRAKVAGRNRVHLINSETE